MKRWLLWTTLALLLVGGAGYFGFTHASTRDTSAATVPPTVAVTRGDVLQTVVAPGKLVGTREILLTVPVAGQVATVHVLAGERVSAGQVMVQLDTRSLVRAWVDAQAALDAAQQKQSTLLAEASLTLQMAQLRVGAIEIPSSTDLAAALAAVTAYQAELDTVQAGPDPADVAMARADLANAEADLRLAQSAYDRVKWRPEIAMLSQAADLARATNAYNAAKARFDRSTAGTGTAQVAMAEARVQQAVAEYERLRHRQRSTIDKDEALLEVARAELAVEQLQAGVDPSLRTNVVGAMQQLAAATVRAPFDGVVLAVHVTPGETIAAGQPLVHFADPSAVEVIATVIEEDLPFVQAGQDVELYFDATPEISVRGHVARIVPQRTSDERPLYPIYITVDSPPAGVLPGMTADGAIVIAQRWAVLMLPRALLRTAADGTAQVKLWRNGTTEQRTIRAGLRGDVYTEIADGLEEGDLVIGQ